MLIVDLTDIARHANRRVPAAGIPRVVAALSQELQQLRQGRQGIAFGYYADVIDSYVLVETGNAFDMNEIKGKIGYGASSRTFRPERYENKPGRYAFHRAKHYVKSCIWKLSLQTAESIPAHITPYEFRAGDHLLMPGSGWNADRFIRHLLEQHIERNFDITVLVHDLIPIVLPDAEGTAPREVFETWLQSVLRLKADILCYSQNSRRDVLRFCAAQNIWPPRTHVVPLAHELKRLETGTIRDDVARLARQGEDYVLFVGPVRGRKNALLLMRLWQRLADEMGAANIPRLVIAGGSGPDDVPPSHRDALTPGITFIRAPNDDELALLYQHTAFSVFLSAYEGWGLPVGESLWHGKTCLAAGNSSLREAGGPFCEYVDLDDPEAMFAKLRHMVSNKAYVAAMNNRINRQHLRTWSDVAREMSCLFESGTTAELRKEEELA